MQRATVGAVGFAGLRAGAQGLSHIQSARSARRHLGHRTRAFHPARAYARARGCAGLLRQPRAARLSDAQERQRTMSATKADFLVELGTEELPPKALRTLERAFADGVETRLRELGLKLG